MSNRARVVNALAYGLVSGVALLSASAWVALLAMIAAATVCPLAWRWPLRIAALALAGLTLWRVPFAEGQALLSDFVLPALLVAVAAMCPRTQAPRAWHLGIAVAAMSFVFAAHEQPITGAMGAALCLMLGALGA